MASDSDNLGRAEKAAEPLARPTSADDSGPRLSRMGSTLEKYRAGKLIPWADAKARLLAKE